MSPGAKLLAAALAVLGLGVVSLLVARSLVGADDPSTGRPPAAPEHGPSDDSSVTIEVTGQGRQAFDGWGGTIVTNTVRDPQARPEGLSRGRLRRLERVIYRRAGINLLRIYGPGFKQPEKHGFGIADDGEGRLSGRDGRWRLMRRGARQGVRFLFTASNAPASMKAGRRLAHGSERRFARYIADNLSFARRQGVPFEYAAIGNEVDNAGADFIPLLIGPRQAATVYRFLAEEIVRRHLPTRLALGDNISWEITLRYATAALRYPRVRQLARVIASHPYGGDAGRAAIGRLARRYGLRVWMTEWVPGPPEGGEVDMGYALHWADQITRDLQVPGASSWFLLRPAADSTHGADSGIIVRTRDDPTSPWYLNKQFHVFRQFTWAAPPGSLRLAVRGTAAALAFRKGRRLSLVVTNSSGGEQTATLRLGEQRGRLRIRRTSPSENFELLPTRAYGGGEVVTSLPAQSVTTFTLSYPRG